MHILIATDGTLDAGKTAELIGRCARAEDQVTVLTVVEVPRNFLSEIRAYYEQPVDAPEPEVDSEYVGDVQARTLSPSWPGDDVFIRRYIDDQRNVRCAPLLSALERAGVEATAETVEGDDPTSAILEFVGSRDVDLLCVGAHGRGRFEGLLGSTSTKLARRAPCEVLLIRQ